MTRLLVLGQGGQIGGELERTLAGAGKVTVCGRNEIDLADPDGLRAAVRRIRPRIIVNAAAYTAVDRAETEPELAMRINGIAPGILAEEARALGALLVHYSTDYVFDGAKPGPYVETDAPNPLNTYGRTKLAGERAVATAGAEHVILRVSWVYSLRGRNFLLTMIKLAAERDEIRVVNDQHGAPSWSRMLARVTRQLLDAELACPGALRGIYHLAPAGAATWHDFATRIVALTSHLRSRDPRLVPIPSAQYPLPAPRPRNSVFDCAKLERALGTALPHWEPCLAECLRELPVA